MKNLTIIESNTPIEVQFRNTSRELCEEADSIIILTRHDLSLATDLTSTIKMRSKEIEEERTKLVKPFNEGVRAINARFKAIIAPLDEAEVSIKSKMLVFQKEEERRVLQEQARIEKARSEAEATRRAEWEAKEKERLRIEVGNAQHLKAENGDDIRSMPLPMPEPYIPAPTIPAPTHKATTYGQTGAVSTVKKVWAFEVTDIAILAAERPDCVCANDVQINREIRGKGGDIPGLRIYEKEIIQVK